MNEPLRLQSFQRGPTGRIVQVEARFHSHSNQHIVLWDDILEVFPGTTSVLNGTVAVTRARDASFRVIEPRCIIYQSERVLEVIHAGDLTPHQPGSSESPTNITIAPQNLTHRNIEQWAKATAAENTASEKHYAPSIYSQATDTATDTTARPFKPLYVPTEVDSESVGGENEQKYSQAAFSPYISTSLESKDMVSRSFGVKPAGIGGPSLRGGSGDARHDMNAPQMGADGWSTVSYLPKAGDLPLFGSTARSNVSGIPSLGPARSVFGPIRKTKGGVTTVASLPEPSRQINSANILDVTSGRRGAVVAGNPTGSSRLNFVPRAILFGAAAEKSKAEDAPETPKKTKDEAQRSIANTLKEYLILNDMNEMLINVKELDAVYRPLLVTEFVNQSMEMKAADVDSIAEVFKKLTAEKIVSAEDFQTGFADPLEFLPDTAIDVPNAYKYTAQLLEAAGMDPAKAAKP